MSYRRALVTAGIVGVAGVLSTALSDKNTESSLEVITQAHDRMLLPVGYQDILSSLGEIKDHYPIISVGLHDGKSSLVLSTVDYSLAPGDDQFDFAVAFLDAPQPRVVRVRSTYAGRKEVAEDVALPAALGINLNYDIPLKSEQKEHIRSEGERRYGVPSRRTGAEGNFHVEWATISDHYILTLSSRADGAGETITLAFFKKR